VETRRRKQDQPADREHVALLSLIDPKNVEESIKDEYWVKAMKEELDQIE